MDQDGPEGNRIEKSSIERFNALAAKWTYDGTSVRDNQAVIACNVVRNSATETMGIRVMAPAITSKGISSRMSAVVTPAAFISGRGDLCGSRQRHPPQYHRGSREGDLSR